MTHLYGPAVRCKPKVKKMGGVVLRICIPATSVVMSGVKDVTNVVMSGVRSGN